MCFPGLAKVDVQKGVQNGVQAAASTAHLTCEIRAMMLMPDRSEPCTPEPSESTVDPASLPIKRAVSPRPNIFGEYKTLVSESASGEWGALKAANAC